MNSKVKTKKYAFGTPYSNSNVKNYLESPSDAISENDINIAEAMYKGNTNPLYLTLKALGNATMQAGGMMGGSGVPGLDGLVMGLGNAEFALGGTVEGGEGEDDYVFKIKNPDGSYSLVKIPAKGYQVTDHDVTKEITPIEKPFQSDTLQSLKTPHILPPMQKVKQAPAFNSKTRKVNDREFYSFGLGGTAPGEVVEVEGEEVADLPNGQVKTIQGPSHEEGGVDMFLPEGTQIFSDRIKVDGITMADRKKKREFRLKKLEKNSSSNPADMASKNSLQRTKAFIDKENEEDLEIQRLISSAIGDYTKAAYGYDEFTTINKKPISLGIPEVSIPDLSKNIFSDPSFTLENDELSSMEDFIMQLGNEEAGGYFGKAGKSNARLNTYNKIISPNSTGTGESASAGNALSMAGNLFSTFAPLINTLKSRATDTPNRNAYLNFGEDALDSIDASKQYIQGQEDKAISDIDLSTMAAKKSNRSNSRSINTSRALDLATDQQANRSKIDARNVFARDMMSILGQEAGLKNQRDHVVMQGEAQKDLANRMDKDNFYTQRGKDLSTVGQGLQETGGDVNAIRQNEIMLNLINQLSDYGLGFDNKGNLIKVN